MSIARQYRYGGDEKKAEAVLQEVYKKAVERVDIVRK